MFKLNQSKGYRSTRNKTAIVDILVMSGRLIIRKQQLEKGDFELQEAMTKAPCASTNIESARKDNYYLMY